MASQTKRTDPGFVTDSVLIQPDFAWAPMHAWFMASDKIITTAIAGNFPAPHA